MRSSFLKKIATFFLLVVFCQNSFAEPDYSELSRSNYLFLIDQDTKEVLLERNADARIVPSSMTKLMTSYIIFGQLKKGIISLDNQCVIGKDALRNTGSRMLLGFGDVVTIDKLLVGLLVASGNDAAVALAEASSGSVENFVDLMNQTAEKIGLKNSHFKNPHGLNQEGHYMSLRDLSILTTRLAADFPEYLHYFSTPEFTYQNLTRQSHNPLIKIGYEGATGMKTGLTNKGGYGMVGTATRGSRRLIAITNEARTAKQRDATIIGLLDYGFYNFRKVTFFEKNQTIIKAKVWLGEKSEVELVNNQGITITIPEEQSLEQIKVKVKYKGPIYAPISKNDKIADLIVEINNKKVREIPLFAKENIDKANYFGRIYQITKHKCNQFLKLIKK